MGIFTAGAKGCRLTGLPVTGLLAAGLLVGASLLPEVAKAETEPLSAEPLSADQLAQLFGVFDTDQDEQISEEELSSVMESFHLDLGTEEVDKLFASYDLDQDNYLQRPEFDRLMNGFGGTEEDLPAMMERAFMRFDENHDGGLDARELTIMMTTKGQSMSLREAKEIVLEADDNGNGRIDVKEFRKIAG